MGSHRARLAIVLALATIPVACAPAPAPFSGEHGGLVVEGQVTDTGSSIAVDVVVRNERDEVVHLETDQCGRVTDVELDERCFAAKAGTGAARSRRRRNSSSAVSASMTMRTRSRRGASAIARRRYPIACVPTTASRSTPGASIAERWELPFANSRTLREVGSDQAVVSIEAIEARDPNAMEYFDIVYFLDEDADRAGRVARAELPLSPASWSVARPKR